MDWRWQIKKAHPTADVQIVFTEQLNATKIIVKSMVLTFIKCLNEFMRKPDNKIILGTVKTYCKNYASEKYFV